MQAPKTSSSWRPGATQPGGRGQPWLELTVAVCFWRHVLPGGVTRESRYVKSVVKHEPCREQRQAAAARVSLWGFRVAEPPSSPFASCVSRTQRFFDVTLIHTLSKSEPYKEPHLLPKTDIDISQAAKWDEEEKFGLKHTHMGTVFGKLTPRQ